MRKIAKYATHFNLVLTSSKMELYFTCLNVFTYICIFLIKKEYFTT